MARYFSDVYKKILEVAPQRLATKLKENAPYWAPENLFYMLSMYVNKYLAPSSKDPKAIQVYAILCNCSEAEMKARFKADGI